MPKKPSKVTVVKDAKSTDERDLDGCPFVFTNPDDRETWFEEFPDDLSSDVRVRFAEIGVSLTHTLRELYSNARHVEPELSNKTPFHQNAFDAVMMLAIGRFVARFNRNMNELLKPGPRGYLKLAVGNGGIAAIGNWRGEVYCIVALNIGLQVQRTVTSVTRRMGGMPPLPMDGKEFHPIDPANLCTLAGLRRWAESESLEGDLNEQWIRMRQELQKVVDGIGLDETALQSDGVSVEWTEWTQTKVAKTWFYDHIESDRGWTAFANRCRKEKLIKNHPTGKAKKIKIHRKVFIERGLKFPPTTG